MAKIRVGVIFGGRSGEHEVSLRSAESVINALDKSKYEIVPIGITKAGKWLASSQATALLPQQVMDTADHPVAIVGDPTSRGLQRTDTAGQRTNEPLDVIFPVLHGTYGEDGTLQGLLDMADIPYVGCGVLASACGMDKVIMKRLFREAGLPIVDFVHVTRTEWESDQDAAEKSIISRIGFPCFVKPANLGSSVGISRAENQQELNTAIALAARFDRKIIIEHGVNAREIEVSVLGNDKPVASLPGEIATTEHAEFYDYKAKYQDPNGAVLLIPAPLSEELTEKIQTLAIQAFKAIDGEGLARADFFLERSSGQLYVNELNTMPGFTSISMYPKMWEASGLSYSNLLDRLIELAFERHAERQRNRTSYD